MSTSYYNYDGTGISAASENVTPDTNLPTFTEPLGIPGAARQLAAGSTTANTALTAGVFRISMRAVGADIRFALGAGSQTANATTSHFIANGERLDFAVPPDGNIAVIRDGSTSGTLEVTELI
jgi:hypothetical protein